MHRYPANNGFTIVELLVVVSIIVLLLAILLPSMSRAREVSRRAVCAAQLHQLGVGQLEYASDNFNTWAFGSPSQMLTDRAGATNTPGVWSIWKKNLYNKGINDGWHGNGVLYHEKYLNDGRVFYCPSWKHPYYEYLSTDPDKNGWPVNSDPWATGQDGVRQTYHYRNTLDKRSGFRGRPPHLNLDRGHIPVMADGFARTTGSPDFWTIPGVTNHHVEGYNVMFIDTSVVWRDDRDARIGDLLLPHTGWNLLELAWQEYFTDGF
ncbi:MAG: prepilin-type N-terminal cleavage/methylation domain-containing protein [Phycisphaera sp.]|nr:prepilin-type N-terminal cleavage/methylation domain-containing protein [Phycisphaera sp.]